MDIKQIREDVVQGLLAINAVSINISEPFIWASGIKSPVYCDNRKSIGHYALRRTIAEGLAALVKEHFAEATLIGGTATAGIPHATSVADQLALPLVYFRGAPKGHGTQSLIEGDYQAGARIVIVEDLISTGGSVLKAVTDAQKNGLDVCGVVSIVNYGLQAAVDNFTQANIAVQSLVDFSDMYRALSLPEDARTFIDTWRTNPNNAQLWDKQL